LRSAILGVSSNSGVLRVLLRIGFVCSQDGLLANLNSFGEKKETDKKEKKNCQNSVEDLKVHFAIKIDIQIGET
jgi:hypothetical protein